MESWPQPFKHRVGGNRIFLGNGGACYAGNHRKRSQQAEHSNSLLHEYGFSLGSMEQLGDWNTKKKL
jgi:hypothetical protein